jgi:hypothetical protein
MGRFPPSLPQKWAFAEGEDAAIGAPQELGGKAVDGHGCLLSAGNVTGKVEDGAFLIWRPLVDGCVRSCG